VYIAKRPNSTLRNTFRMFFGSGRKASFLVRIVTKYHFMRSLMQSLERSKRRVRGIPRQYLRAMHGQTFTRPSITFICVALLTGCTGMTYWYGPSGIDCKAYCSTVADDGKSCVKWTSAASDACTGKFTAARYCCNSSSGSLMCRMVVPGAEGLGCTSVQPTPWGPQYVPGLACNN